MDKTYFINCTNHPYQYWDEGQKRAAHQFGEVIDVPFPQVNPNGTEIQIKEQAKRVVDEILKLHPQVVLCQGEFTLTHQIIMMLKEYKIVTVAACCERASSEEKTEDGSVKKTSYFKFVQFRQY